MPSGEKMLKGIDVSTLEGSDTAKHGDSQSDILRCPCLIPGWEAL
jgi:hypothetical protein